MKKTVLTFGLVAGLILSVLMDGNVLLAGKIGSGHSLVLGYANMVASFLLIYFGIRSYRDNTLAGQISFGRAFACGILIARGFSNREIATQLFVSENTVKTHCARAFDKLGAARRTQAVQRGKELGLLP